LSHEIVDRIIDENDKRILQSLKDNMEKSVQNQKAKADVFKREIARQLSEANNDPQFLEYTEKLKQAHQMKLKKLAQIKDELKIREQNLKQQSSLFEKYKLIFCTEMDKFTKTFQRLSPESKQKLDNHKKITLALFEQFDKINKAETYSSAELDTVDKICKNLETINQNLLDEEARANEEELKKQQQRAEQEQAARDAVDHQRLVQEEIATAQGPVEATFRKIGTSENLKRYEQLKESKKSKR
jgi:hypothetical protein